VQRFSAPADVGLRRPLAAPARAPAVAQRRAADVLPVGPAIAERGRRTWTAALVATVARTGWLAVVLAAAFVGGTFLGAAVRGQSVTGAAPWAGMGGGVWLVVSLAWTILRRR